MADWHLCEQRHLPQDRPPPARPILGGAVFSTTAGWWTRRAAKFRFRRGGTNSGTFNAATNADNNFNGPLHLQRRQHLYRGRNQLFDRQHPHFQWRHHRHERGQLAMELRRRSPARLTIPSGSTLNIVSGNTHNMPGAILTNNGTIVDAGGNDFQCGNGSVIYNNGLWLEEADHYIYNPYGGSGHLGQCRHLPQDHQRHRPILGPGLRFCSTTAVWWTRRAARFGFRPAGPTAARSMPPTNADNNFNGPYTFNDGSLFTGPGLTYLTGGTLTFNGNTTSSNLQFNGATTDGPGLSRCWAPIIGRPECWKGS